MIPRHAGVMLVFLLGLALAAFVAPEIIYRNDRKALNEVALIDQHDREILFRELFEQSKSSQRNLANDYTFWDDMIRFADGKLDNQWGEENLDAGIASFHVSGIWVVDRNGAVRYGVVSTPEGETTRDDRLPLPLAVIRETVSRDTLPEFYRRIGDTTYTVMAAGIVPTADIERATPPQGHFLAIAPVDDELLHRVEGPTGTTVSLLPPDTPEVPSGLTDEATGTYVFWHQLQDEHGEGVGVLRVERSSETVATLATQISTKRIANGFVFGALWALLAVVGFLLDRARIRAAAHTEKLQGDIEQRKKTEEALRGRTHELEMANKSMIDRELRMVELKKQVAGKE